jgi:hypothetical protein
VGKLVLLLSDGTTRDIPLGKERLVIGRRADNDVCLPYPAVSGEHASVVTILADSFLEDLGSTNGTLVNGKPIVKHFLRDHDQIDIGRQRLVYVSDDDAKVEGLPLDIAHNQLLGLTERVPAARRLPGIDVPPAGRPRNPPLRPHLADLSDFDADLQHEPVPEQQRTPPPPRTAAIPRTAPASAYAPPPGAPPAARAEAPSAPPAKRDADMSLAAWTADWAAPTGHRGAGAIDTAAATLSAVAAPPAVAAAAAVPVDAPAAPVVRILSGPSAGRNVPFEKDELSVGRVGVQVAVVRKVGEGFRLVPIEGARPPRINGTPVAHDGAVLHPGDTFEVAGVRLELSLSR